MEPVLTDESAGTGNVEWQAEVTVRNIFGGLAFVFDLFLFLGRATRE
jgi:hypothetical protein